MLGIDWWFKLKNNHIKNHSSTLEKPKISTDIFNNSDSSFDSKYLRLICEKSGIMRNATFNIFSVKK